MASNQGSKTLLHFQPQAQGYPAGPSSSHSQFSDLNPPPFPVAAQQQYGAPEIFSPPKAQYGASIAPSQQYAPAPEIFEPPKPQYGAPPTQQYGPPKIFAAPNHQYGAPLAADQFISGSQKSPKYKLQQAEALQHSTPKPLKYVPLKLVNLELGPKPPKPGPPIIYGPLLGSTKTHQNYKPIFAQHNAIPVQFGGFSGFENVQSNHIGDSQGSHSQTQLQIPVFMVPPKPNQQIYYQHQGTSPQRRPPSFVSKPALPIYPPQNFQNNFAHHDSAPQQTKQFNSVNPGDIQIIPSIPVAGYLASIEHPVNVIQSPVLEVDVKEDPADSAVKGDNELEKPHRQSANENHSSLSENPIVVDDDNTDAHVAESSLNDTYHNEIPNKRGNDRDIGTASFQTDNVLKDNVDIITKFLNEQHLLNNNENIQSSNNENRSSFSQPPMSFGKWTPSEDGTPSPSMTPPPYSQSVWINSLGSSNPVSLTTKKPKHIQVIIPYITSQKPKPFQNEPQLYYPTNQGRKVPPNTQQGYRENIAYTRPPVWSQYMNNDFFKQSSQNVEVSTKSPHKLSNIRDILRGEATVKPGESLPFDIITLQKNIDHWTQQEYSKNPVREDFTPSTTSAKFVPSKQIPSEYLTTEPYENQTETSDESIYDHVASGSNHKETKLSSELSDIDTNLIAIDGSSTLAETTTEGVEILTKHRVESHQIHRNGSQVSVSPETSEKVYIVTPVPRAEGAMKNRTFKTATFAIRLESENETKMDNASGKVIYSEWPHLSKCFIDFFNPRAY